MAANIVEHRPSEVCISAITLAELRFGVSPIGELDALIATHALTLDITLITNNAKRFTRVPGLQTGNWL